MPRTVSRLSLGTRGADVTVVTVASGAERRGRSPSRGPVVVVTANVHGDETTGVGAVLRLIPLLDATLTHGTVHLYPSLNPEALERRARKVPDDDLDLNRLFPGDAEGSPAERLAHAAWTDIAARHPDLVIDLHADAPGALPYALLDRAVHLKGQARAELEADALRLAIASGLTVLHEYPDDRYTRYRLDRSLSGAILNRLKIPAVTLEAGPRLHLDDAAVSAMVGGVLGMLHALDMVSEAVEPHASRIGGGPWRRDSGPRAASSGILFARTQPGKILQRGTVVAEIRGLNGSVVQELTADSTGFVVSPAERTHVVAGVPVCTWAQAE